VNVSVFYLPCWTKHLPSCLFAVHYEGTLENGEVFDTTHEDNSIFSFEVGQGAVIKAWDLALRTMKVCELLIASSD
jgi:FKBP-type peptidyl-prolyl cis-trans isomerase